KVLPYDDINWPPKADYVVDVTDFVQSWVTNPSSNYGMRVQMDPEESDSYMFFYSGQAPDSLKPRLEICYDTTNTPIDCTAGYRDTLYATDRSTHYFTALADTGGARRPSQICWSFGDGTDSCATYDSAHPWTGTPVVHTYPAEHGNYVACITINYNDRCQAIHCDSVRMPSTCTANFSVVPEGPESRKYYFTGQLTNSDNKKPVRVCLSYGDGADTCLYYDSTHPYTGIYLVHTYSANDSMQACMTVQYQDSCSAYNCVGIPPSSLCTDNQYLTLKANPADARFRQAVVIEPQNPSEFGEPNSDLSQTEMIAASWFTYSPPSQDRRTLFRYDVSEIPANAVVQHAYLYLYAKTNNVFGIPAHPMVQTGNGNQTALLRIASPWSLSTVKWKAQPSYTWAGARYLEASDTPHNYIFDVTDIVQDWVSRADSNYGWLLRIADEGGGFPNTMIFTSGTAPDSLRPKLTICYSLPDTMEARRMYPGGAPMLAAQLYPNPATDALTINVRTSLPQTGAVYLYDIGGRMVQVLKTGLRLLPGSNIIHAPIDRTHVPPGIYFVKIQMANGLRTYKVTLK
ncbi:MAG: DNRLRE domain-containing protein, partial [Bacteroidetes bacterium]|nr:DNRLRE domain-containing protein [Bacteroidota bacterium]